MVKLIRYLMDELKYTEFIKLMYNKKKDFHNFGEEKQVMYNKIPKSYFSCFVSINQLKQD